MERRQHPEIRWNENEYSLPPRRQLYPSSHMKFIKRFYQFMLFLFVALWIGLFIWGMRLLKEI
jgi:hypothetical protein